MPRTPTNSLLRLLYAIMLAAFVIGGSARCAAFETAADSIAAAPDSVRVELSTVSYDIAPAEDFAIDSIAPSRFSDYEVWEAREVEFNPDPTRAVWMSALFPGLGQVYNRRYWKIPIVYIIGGWLPLRTP